MPLVRSVSTSALDARPAVTFRGGALSAVALDDIDALSRDPAQAAQAMRDERASRDRRAEISALRAAPGRGLTAAQLSAGAAALRKVDPDEILRERIARRRMGVDLGAVGPKVAGPMLRDYMRENRLVPWRPEDLTQVVALFDTILTTAELADVAAEVGKWEAAFEEVMNGARDGYKRFCDTLDAQLSADKAARDFKIQLGLMGLNLVLSSFGLGPVGTLITGAVTASLDPEGLARLGGLVKGTADLIVTPHAYGIAAAGNLAKGSFDALTKLGVDQLNGKLKDAMELDKKAAQYNKKIFDLNDFQSEMTRALRAFKETVYREHGEIVRRYRERQQITTLLWELCRSLSTPYAPLMDAELVAAARQARDFLRKRCAESLAAAFACPVEVAAGSWRAISVALEKALWALWADQALATGKLTLGDKVVDRLVELQVMERRDYGDFLWNRERLATERAAEERFLSAAEQSGTLADVEALRVRTGKHSSGSVAARNLARWAQLYLNSQPFQRIIPLNRQVAERILAYQASSAASR